MQHTKTAPDAPPAAATWRDHVIVCGLGSAGIRVAEGLLQAGAHLVAVDNGPDTPFRRGLAQRGVPLIDGDCTAPDTLRQAGVIGAQAVVVVVNHDMISLQTALAARELNPQARIVARLFNLRMAQHLQDLPARITALALSAIAAPIFILGARCAALRGAFTLHGATWALGSLPTPDGDRYPIERWRQLGTVVLACTAPDGRLTLCPAPDLTPLPGSALLVATPPARLAWLAERAERLREALDDPSSVHRADVPALARVRRSGVRLRAMWRGVRLFWRQANRALRFAVLALCGLLILGVLVFHVFYPLRFVDALYFTTTLVTTVGLGDYNLQHAAPALKLFGIFVMLMGTFLTALAYGLVVEFVLRQRLDTLAGARLDTLRDHYVVAGLGTVGFRVVSALHEAGERVVVIESSEEGRFMPQVRALRVPVVIGDAALEETLRRARIDGARALIAVTSNDLVNIEAVLNARAIRPEGHVVLRVFDADLAAQARQSLAIPASFSSSQVGAPAFVAAALGHEATQVLRLPLDGQAPSELTLRHYQVEPGDSLCGQRLDQIGAAQGAAVLLYQPGGGEEQFAPAPDRVAAPGDLVVLAIPGLVSA